MSLGITTSPRLTCDTPVSPLCWNRHFEILINDAKARQALDVACVITVFKDLVSFLYRSKQEVKSIIN